MKENIVAKAECFEERSKTKSYRITYGESVSDTVRWRLGEARLGRLGSEYGFQCRD